jgi:acyl transferase domain-containing protein/NADP-dependent 3-hydroxy acid dehydrogenase YdfG
VKRGGFLGAVDFDPMEFGIPPTNLRATDTSQLLALIVAKAVLEDATRGQFERINRERASVILGVTSGQELWSSLASRLQKPVWLKALRESGIPEDEAQQICVRIADHYQPWVEASFPGLLGNVVAGRIANRFDLHGTNCITDAACASSLSAMSMGVNELALGHSDLVITGGVDTMNDPFMFSCFSKTPALSKSGDCRPFSDKADGTMLGEGLAMFALKRLADAQADGDRIYAVIRSIGTSSDGRSKSIYAPLSDGQSRALRRAYDLAGYGPDTVELVEAHGTGTNAGDAAEFAALRDVFDASGRGERQWCAIGSVKSQIGHTKAAAGAAGLFKAVMALHHKVLPPTIKVERPNPRLEIDNSPFYLNTEPRPWVRASDHPRRASVSSFGFGGTNFHVTLEEYRVPASSAPRVRTSPVELVLLAADDASSLVADCQTLAAAAGDDVALATVARRSQQAFRPLTHRLAIIAANRDELGERLRDAVGRIARDPQAAFSTPGGIHYGVGLTPGRIAFLFPGQGSQYLGMGADVAMGFDEALAVWDAAAELGLGLHERVFPKPVFDEAARDAQFRALTDTKVAQPAIAAMSLSLLAILERMGLKADCAAGHSLGELTALHAAGVLDAPSLLRVARRRGELMGDAASVAPGAMLAVSGSEAVLRERLGAWGLDLVIANINHPGQVVLSGTIDAIEEAARRLEAEKITAKRLPVSAAFHSSLVAPATGPFAESLAQIALAQPRIDAYSGAEAAPYPPAPAAIRERLARQIVLPVRFVEQIEAMYAAGVRTFVEVGPATVLSDLVGRILGDRPHQAVATNRKGKNGVATLWEALGRLAVLGAALDFAPLWERYAPPVESVPKKKPGLTVPISGANYGKPYPPPGGSAALPAPNLERSAEASVDVAASALNVASDSRVTAAEGGEDAGRLAASASAVIKRFAELHAEYHRSITESHAAFQRGIDASLAQLGAFAVDGAAGPVRSLSFTDGVSSPSPDLRTPALPAGRLDDVSPASPPDTSVSVASASAGPDLQALMLEVVAEKTGYPTEMLELRMELEADLGIDSIKRVEILSALRERVPGLPQMNTAELGALRTLEQVVDYLRATTGAIGLTNAPEAAVPLRSPAAAEVSATPVASTAASPDLQALMLEVVAEKTGYPAEMLEPQMELEADLGIDSIKRVEILSALRERVPALPQMNTAELGALRTLQQVVDYLRQASGTSGVSMAPPAASLATNASAAEAFTAAVTSTAASPDLQALMLEVLSEKTGYPAEMLELRMELEADLGIDSIKRVEILSALRERVPALPQMNTAELGALRTLEQVVDHLRQSTASSPAASTREADEMATTRVHDSLQRFVIRAVTVPPAAARAPDFGPTVVVTDDGRGIAGQLVKRLAARGVPAQVVTQVPADATSVVFLGGLRDVVTASDAVLVERQAFAAAKAVAGRFESDGGVFVTVQDTGGDFGLSGVRERAWLAGIPGLVRVAASEWPNASVKAIDLERGARSTEEIATAIDEELLAGWDQPEVGLHADGRRVIRRVQEAGVRRSGAAPVHSQSVIVATGGARGVTSAALKALARAAQPRIALIGRTEIIEEPAACRGIADEATLKAVLFDLAKREGRRSTPSEIGEQASRIIASREIAATMTELREAGCEVRYLSLDVRDAATLEAALAGLRSDWGPVTGIVHGAGVLADKRICDQTDAQFDRVFDTKVEGLRALLGATRNDPLSLLCLFSSTAGWDGFTGQVAYAMANDVLNAVAAAERRRRSGRCVVRSICWAHWDGGMVKSALRTHLLGQGLPMIPLEEGARALVDELMDADSPETVVLIRGTVPAAQVEAAERPPRVVASAGVREVAQ